MYTLYRRLIALRRSKPALTSGNYQGILAGGDVLQFMREEGGDRLSVVLNLGAGPASAGFAPEDAAGEVLLSSHLDRDGEEVRGTVDLRPNEGVVIELARGRTSE